ncbi:importin subunit alpha-1b-like [Apium graveolens]|uniref:importin subunit alpha-1b-like n=1 Tax=Apium graveolens TaxID=4045 RepID=UPI003D7C08B1
MQGLWLLHTIAITYSKFPDEALELLVSFLTDRSTVHDVLCVSGRTSAVACQINPKLPCDKLMLVVRALMELLKSEHSDIYPSGCAGIVYLCEGREEIIFENEYFECLIEKPYLCHVLNISRAAALGSIVRCGSDDDIDQVIIKKGLCLFKVWLSNKDKYIVKNACWIISNIAARKEDHIKAAIDFELIDPLVHIVENYESLDVKKEAAWAISNAIHGAGPDQIGDMRNRCVEPFWNLLKECHENQEIVSLCLEALVGLKGIDITCNDEPIDVVEWFKVFKKFMVRPETPQFQLAEDIDELTKLKKLRSIDTIENCDGDMVLHLTCTFEDNLHFSRRITP